MTFNLNSTCDTDDGGKLNEENEFRQRTNFTVLCSRVKYTLFNLGEVQSKK